ncbi:MAG TPA: Gfo/Idh/MocA family oxidoreductase [Acidobacteriaceae bacterium]|jgi:predicted dehydrogenase|nr:Gfo/Idh/MocA family oxidoreductase [Acidobacteriaceae bacterium]
MLKTAIIGCGKIADAHAEQLRRIPGCEIVGVCDREPLMARQLYDRFPVRAYFTDIGRLLEEARPDVVHVTTPPESHFSVAMQCMAAGCHVYVEKPFALDESEARQMIAAAQAAGRKITAGHDDQFSHVARRMRGLIAEGYLGGPPVHMESYYCYELKDSAYANALLQDKAHWVRRLPGKLLHNIISHGIARIAEHLDSDTPEVFAHGYRSRFLVERNELDLIDELRVVIADGYRTTAYFTFSSQMRPALHQFRIYGPGNGILLDQDQETLVRLRGERMKSYLEKFVTPLLQAHEYCSNVRSNFRLFRQNDFHMKSGMKYLIESFYRAIEAESEPPISYREILLTTRIMGEIFRQVNAGAADAAPVSQLQDTPVGQMC